MGVMGKNYLSFTSLARNITRKVSYLKMYKKVFFILRLKIKKLYIQFLKFEKKQNLILQLLTYVCRRLLQGWG